MVAPGQWHKEHIWKGKESTIIGTFCLVFLSSKIMYLPSLMTTNGFMHLVLLFLLSFCFTIKEFVKRVHQCNNHQMHYQLNHHYQRSEENK